MRGSVAMQVIHFLPPIFHQPDLMVKDCGSKMGIQSFSALPEKARTSARNP